VTGKGPSRVREQGFCALKRRNARSAWLPRVSSGKEGLAKSTRQAKRAGWRNFPQASAKKFDTSKFLLYTLCFVRASVSLVVAGHGNFGVPAWFVVGRIFASGTEQDGMGARSGRIWDASPAKAE
jgi:hypothetical protein